MSSELFENRQEDFTQIYSNVKRRIREELPKCSGEVRKRLINESKRQIDEAYAMVEDMERELRTAPASFRTQMSSIVRTYRQDIAQLSNNLEHSHFLLIRLRRPAESIPDIKKILFRKASDAEADNKSSTDAATSSRDVSVSASYNFDDELPQDHEAAQRARLMQCTASLTRAGDSIARSHAISAETDQIGADIIDDLGVQRESLLRTRDRLTETDQNLSRSRKLLKTMTKRIMTNKIILVVVIFAELGILAGVIYWRFFSGTK